MKFFEVTCVADMRDNGWYPPLHEELEHNFCVAVTDTYYRSNDDDFIGERCVRILIAAHNPDVTYIEVKSAAIEGMMHWLGNKNFDKWYETYHTKIKVKEVSFLEGLRELNYRERRGIARKFDMNELIELLDAGNHLGQSGLLTNTLIPTSAEDFSTLSSACRKTLYCTSLTNELKRIEASSEDTSLAASKRHTVFNYAFEIHSSNDVREPLNILIKALRRGRRLRENNIYTLDFYAIIHDESSPGIDHIKTMINKNFVQCLEGSLLIIDYSKLEEGSAPEYAAYTIFDKLLSHLRESNREIQVIFLLPSNSNDLLQRIKRKLTVPVIHLLPDTKPMLHNLSNARIKKEITQHLSTKGFTLNKTDKTQIDSLISRAKDDKSFNGTVLDLAERWINEHYLKTFPGYAEVAEIPMIFKADCQGKSAWDDLDELIGLKEVKHAIKQTIASFRIGQVSARKGMPHADFSLHAVFQGSPGTGKTEVARIYGRILKEMGVLQEGRVISVSGSTLGNIPKLFNRAKGSVLFVDEAYAIAQSDSSDIATFIAEMENHRQDTVVILAGYTRDMELLMSTNAGFRSRIGSFISFPDYTPQELEQIFNFMVNKRGLTITDSAQRLVRNRLNAAGMKPSLGNARFARNLVEKMQIKQRERLAKAGDLEKLNLTQLATVTQADISPEKPEKPGVLQLNELIGLEPVKDEVNRQLDFFEMQKIRRDRGIKTPVVPMHMVFTGNPGTGKTEVARIIGKIAKERGILACGDFYETSKADLVVGIPGASARQVEAAFTKATGSVLFIDEAYSINDGTSSGQETIDALVKNMEDHREKIIVIMAGYTKDMELLLEANAGFASRIRTTIEFPDYNVTDLFKIVKFQAKHRGLRLTPAALRQVQAVLADSQSVSKLGNGRFARQLIEDALLQQGKRLRKKRESGRQLTDRDLITLLPQDITWSPALKSKPVLGFSA